MKKSPFTGLMALGIALVVASCGNSGSGNASGSDAAASDQPKVADCGDIDDYIQKADEYISDASNGTLSESDAADFIQEAQSVANQIESKGQAAFSQECWDRFLQAQQRLASKANAAAEKMMNEAGASMEDAEKMMKEMENMEGM
jgi:hypothetical protein